MSEVERPSAFGVLHPVGTESINRVTGAYVYDMHVGKLEGIGDFKCEAAPFTPFPKAKF